VTIPREIKYDPSAPRTCAQCGATKDPDEFESVRSREINGVVPVYKRKVCRACRGGEAYAPRKYRRYYQSAPVLEPPMGYAISEPGW